MRTHKRLLNFICWGMVLCLAGCVSLNTPTGNALNQKMSWTQRSRQLGRIRSWKLTGAMAIRTHTQSLTAHIIWQQKNANQYRINLFGPLAVNSTLIVGNRQKITLYLPNQKPLVSKTPELLLEQELGWQLPIKNLYYWVRGLPAPRIKNQKTFDVYHHLIQLHQQGWTVSYSHYINRDGIDLPHQIILDNLTLRIKLVIKNFSKT